MKNISKVIWGIVLIIVGVIFALNWIFDLHVNIFFDGWWTLFIIVPCFVGLFSEHEKTGNVIGIIIGVCLLLWRQNILDLNLLWKIGVPAVIIIIGIKLIYSYFFDSKNGEKIKELRLNPWTRARGTAAFSGLNMNFNGEVFKGAELGAYFGGLKCDLTGALITEDCLISASAVFGGIDIIVPDNVNLKVKSNSLFGGVSNKAHRPSIEGAPTIYVEANCMFGGVDLK